MNNHRDVESQTGRIAAEASNRVRREFRETFESLNLPDRALLYLLVRSGQVDVRGFVGETLEKARSSCGPEAEAER